MCIANSCIDNSCIAIKCLLGISTTSTKEESRVYHLKMSECLCECVYECMCMFLGVCMCLCVSVCMCVCKCVSVCEYICIRICMYVSVCIYVLYDQNYNSNIHAKRSMTHIWPSNATEVTACCVAALTPRRWPKHHTCSLIDNSGQISRPTIDVPHT